MTTNLHPSTHELIIDIRDAFREFERRVDADAPAWIRADIPRMIEHTWYCLVHPSYAPTALIEYGCRLRDTNHPFAPAVFSFGVLLQDTLDELGLDGTNNALRHYHFVRRHGRHAIVVSYEPSNHA